MAKWDCPKCGYANPGPVDWCQNCNTHLGWVTGNGEPDGPTDGPTKGAGPGPKPTVPDPTRYGVHVTIEAAELTVDPGNQVTTTVTVRNLGSRVEEFQLTASGAAGSYASIEPPTLSVLPDAEQSAVARFAPLREPKSSAGVAAFAIMARSTVKSDVIDVAKGDLTVTAFQDLHAVLQPDVSRGHRPGRHRVNVTNGGNTPVNTQLTFNDQDGELTFDPPSGATTLPPGGTLGYSVRINGRHRWFGRITRHPFSAVITPAAPQQPITLNGTRQQTAVFPWWIPTAAAAIVAIAIAVYAAWPGPKVPQVADFTQSVAEKALQDTGYVVSGATPTSDPKQAGLVVKTDPAAGSPLERGQRVQVLVSTGPCNPVCKVTVPATKGKTEADARTVLGAAGFTVGQIVPGPSDLPAGSVKETSPAEQTQAPTNVAVVVFVSSGASLKLPPDQLAGFQGQSAANVKKALGNSFTVRQVPEHSNEFAAGKVLRADQDPTNPKLVTLTVAAPTATDLVALASKASWSSSAGKLTFPGKATDAKGAVLVRNATLPGGTTGRVLEMIAPSTGSGSVTITGVFTLPTSQAIIAGDRLKTNVGASGPAQFAIKIGGQALPITPTTGAGSLMAINEPLDAFIGANTIEITVTGTLSAAPAAPGGVSPHFIVATPSQVVWQGLRIEGVVKNP